MTKLPDAALKATQPLVAVRQALLDARSARSPEDIHAALTSAIDGLISHAEKQARDIEALRSDLSHKQGIVSRIDGDAYRSASPHDPGSPANDEGDV